MKTTYKTVILRYVHDVVTGEFVNVGLVIYAPEARFLKSRICTSCERLEAMFVKVDYHHLSELFAYLTNSFKETSAELRAGSGSSTRSLSEILSQVLPSDDSSLQWSEQGGGFTDDPEKTLNELYFRCVERYRRKLTDSQRISTTR